MAHRPFRGASVPDSTVSGNEAQGWLWKKSGIFAVWKRKYFILRGPLLSYYDNYPAEEFNSSTTSRGDSSPMGVLRVVHVDAASVGFRVYGSSGKVIHIRADNSNTDKKWMKVCLRAAALLQRRKESVDSEMSSIDTYDTSTSTSSSCDSYDFSGWLRCEKGIKYFVVQGNMLTMYDNKQPWCVPTYRGYIQTVSKKGSSDFTVALRCGKAYHLHASSPSERDQWAQVLHQSSRVIRGG
ncbi:hypothetical protein LEN26_011361 [Aphanomyces euteiches]|nr:hypothetical protein LEN26_011361 [Aphanomyces euteiches]KAH9126081.1 hypothetical protein AeMF1_003419 [Aphanomyces euteiches]KAH9189625.1 hypothetical protein AeNC1_008386 [Aphanomyces euteiches]